MFPPDKSFHRFAVSRLHLPDGSVLKNQVIEYQQTSENKFSARYYPLTEEIPFTEWRGGDFHWPSDI
ncbi:hypothetical protein IMSAGC014_01098 [Bacteroidaceae bacterium]|uniref:hypothetical protein n=1 Tax=Prevotella sp. MGM2 TaxID=2033406 RepID=UPI000CEA5ECC|nr:hypothetical protein [Prevotella sp. MGM2]GFI34603.1 hypothetical protein IMSAGC014_01098 [Bacteroidaceae bacterium]